MEELLSEGLNWASKVWAGKAPIEAVTLPIDGSSRAYYRLRRSDRPDSRVLMIGPDRDENLRSLVLGRGLWFKRFPVPRIYAHNLDLGFILLEDLGDLRLDRLFLENGLSPQLLSCYQKAVTILANLHEGALEALYNERGFLNVEYIQRFAFENEFLYFIDGLKLLNLIDCASDDLLYEGLRLSGDVADKTEPLFIHRDFQSRNLMLKDELLYFIDFQGARLGPATYDLASLLYDPYVDLTEEIRESLMEQYLSMRKGADIVDLSKLEIRRAGLLRLMQAFGAYAKLSVLAGKASKFQAYLSPALDRISWLLNLYFSKEYPLVLDFVSSVKLEREIMP